jgi:sugar/nucleoside kinase (ribokinase family)
LGLPFQFAANIGADHFGTWLGAAFPDHALRWPVSPRRTTLSVGLTHPDGERTFFTTNGHLLDMTAADVIATLDGAPLQGGLLLLCGAFVTDALAAGYAEIFDWADRHKVDVALDTGWPTQGWTEHARSQATLWLSRSKIALFNEIEATSLTGTDTVEQAARALHQIMPAGSLALVKRGPDGALAFGPDGLLHHASAKRVHLIDTIGAGDIFNAGFLAALARGLPIPDCLRHGVAIASYAISTLPRQFAPPEQDLTA